MIAYNKLTLKRKHYIEKFKITERDEKEFSNLEDAIRDALKRAFLDINFRTLHDKSDKYPKLNEGETITLFLINELEKVDFLKIFTDYLTKDPVDEATFDLWHHATCEAFLDVFKKYYKDAQYGKAQKIVNMMFKHLYCMNFGENKKDDKSDWLVLDEAYFEHCHLTLDSFTLEWFYREVAVLWYNSFGREIRGNTISKGKVNAWSNIEFRDGLDNFREQRLNRYIENAEDRFICVIDSQAGGYYHYHFLQDIIREFFEITSTDVLREKHKNNQEHKRKKTCFTISPEQTKYQSETPFQAEFQIWPEIQLHLTAEALFSQSIGQEEMLSKMREMKEISETDDFEKAFDCYKKMPLDKKINILKEKISILEEYSKCQNNTEHDNGT